MQTVLRWFSEKKWAGRLAISLVAGSVMAFLMFYVFLPPLHPQAGGFWIYLAACLFFYLMPFLRWSGGGIVVITAGKTPGAPRKKVRAQSKEDRVGTWLWLAVVLPVVIVILGSIGSSSLFFARTYASIIEVEDGDFAADMPESNEVTNIALMDTASASVLGNRTLGSLSDMVSQYRVSTYYTQINYNRTPKKVSNLEYDGFFKWLGNRKNGIPGMVMVDPVKNSAEYKAFPSPMHYAESAYFGKDLERRLRFLYPTKIFDAISFEVDDDGNPFYIVACSRPQVGLFGASDVTEVIIFDPTDGTGEILPVEDVPSWVDIVYTGDLATVKYNWYGTLSGGFLNSVIGNVGCKQATDDFGYIVIDDDVWYFTGVTSVVSDDKSNIGFILTNARTGEYKFYPVIGAEEHSAMAAAEGEVQEKGYVGSFPSLVNIGAQPSYIMVLKDDAGVVKLYALVNVENYSIVATAATQAEAITAYKKLLRQESDMVPEGERADITVENVRIVPMGDTTVVYITATDGNVYKGYLSADESLILIRQGDALTVEYAEGETERVYSIVTWAFATTP